MRAVELEMHSMVMQRQAEWKQLESRLEAEGIFNTAARASNAGRRWRPLLIGLATLLVFSALIAAGVVMAKEAPATLAEQAQQTLDQQRRPSEAIRVP